MTRWTSPISCAEVTTQAAPWWAEGHHGRYHWAFTDARTTLGSHGDRETAARVLAPYLDGDRVAVMNQVHGAEVAFADPGQAPTADALLVDTPHVAAVVRVADCVPLVVIAEDRPLAAVIHAGRAGMAKGVVSATCRAMTAQGASALTAWLGPRICGHCYEVGAELADEVAAIEPLAASTTRWGTPGLDIGAGVRAQLDRAGATIHDLGADVCTMTDESLWSYRRQGKQAGRFGAMVRIKETD